MDDVSTCRRCAASPVPMAADGGCARCGAPSVHDTAETLRQERALAWALQQVADADDAKAAALALQERHAARARLLAAGVQTTAQPPAPMDAAPSPATDEAIVPATTTMRAGPAPLDGRRMGAPPPPRPVLTPAEARARFERRLEIGGWFTGALFAVGGSLWATNLFWSNIPAVLRPIVVGTGLAAFAAAFMAVGAVLAKRHPDSLAGQVLGLVGRLIVVSSTIPLATLRIENTLLWLPTTALIVGGLAAALRFMRRGRHDGDEQASHVVHAFLGGFVLATLAPTSPWLALPIAGASLLVARAGIAGRTMPALAGQQTLVDDLGGVGIGIAGVFSSLFHAQESFGQAHFAAWYAVAVVAVIELIARLVEQRPVVFGLRPLSRWLVALWSLGTALRVIAGPSPLAAVAALGLVAASFRAPGDLGLPRSFSLVSVAALALAASCAMRLLSLSGDAQQAVEVIAGLATVLALTGHHRRGKPDAGERVSSIVLYVGAVIAAWRIEDDAGRIVATTIAALLFVTDRRLERSVVFGLFSVPIALLPFGLAADALFPKADMPFIVGVLATTTLVLHQLRLAAPARPLLSVTTAATWWIVAIGAVAAYADPGRGNALVTTALCAVGLLLLLERSRQVVVGVAGFGMLADVIAESAHNALGLTSLQPARAFAALVIALVAFSPHHRMAHARALRPGWQPAGRARAARSWSASLVASAMVATLLLQRLPRTLGETDVETDVVALGATALLALASILLALRRPGRGPLALVIVALVVAGADAGPLLGLAPAPLLAMGLGGGLVALGAAIVVVALRQRRLQTAVFLRGQRRQRPMSPAVPTLWGTVAVAAVVTLLLTLNGVIHVAGVDAALWSLALACTLGATHALALFCGRAVSPLVGVGVLGFAAAALTLAGRALVAGAEAPTLGWTLSAVGVAVAALVASRALYRGRPVPALLEAWPAPSALRRAGLAIVATLATLLALTGVALQLGYARGEASRYGPGLVMLAIAVGAAAIVGWRVRRTVSTALLGAAALGLVGVGIDGVAHAARWVPKSFGVGQALIAIALIGAILLLDRNGGRALLRTLSLGWPRRVRARLIDLLAVAVPMLAALAVLLGVREAPRAHEPAVLLAGIALAGLAVVLPRERTARLGAVGVILAGAGIAAAVARLAFGHDIALQAQTLPTVALGGLLGALLVQNLAGRLWNSAALQTFHARRLAEDEALLSRCGRAMRGAVELQGLVLLVLIVAMAVANQRAQPLALWSTWFAAALAALLTSRMAVDAARTWPAALGQGMALFIYVDIRRRTPWIDDGAGIDVMACLGAALVFIVISAASRRQPKGASTAQAAELYAVTLPVIAAGLGNSDAGRAVICLIGGGLYALLSRTRRRPAYEFAAGLALVAATTLALSAQHIDDVTLYLLPVAFVGTFLVRRHRASLGALGRSLAVWCHVPLYCASAWSALKTETFAAFALGVIVTTLGVVYSIRARDRRSLYAAASAAATLVIGWLVLLGLDNALLGTVLLAGAGIVLLAGMTVFTIRRDYAVDAVKRATAGLDDWE